MCVCVRTDMHTHSHTHCVCVMACDLAAPCETQWCAMQFYELTWINRLRPKLGFENPVEPRLPPKYRRQPHRSQISIPKFAYLLAYSCSYPEWFKFPRQSGSSPEMTISSGFLAFFFSGYYQFQMVSCRCWLFIFHYFFQSNSSTSLSVY